MLLSLKRKKDCHLNYYLLKDSDLRDKLMLKYIDDNFLGITKHKFITKHRPTFIKKIYI